VARKPEVLAALSAGAPLDGVSALRSKNGYSFFIRKLEMDSMIDYFATIPSWQRGALIGAGFILFWILEILFGASQFAKYRHARTNLPFWAGTLLTNLPLSGLTLATSMAVSEAHLGVLNLFEVPLALNLLLSVAFLDLIAAYVHHRLVHSVPFLWKLHVVHHSDPNVDSTTALRHNPLEAVMRAHCCPNVNRTGSVGYACRGCRGRGRRA
jgi:sterol desaturase/sphingolipid hydroxylase (fatty acid hydroxylase superfamily)